MKTILVIEDNIDALELLASWIRNVFKGVAYTACNVREALEVLGSHQFDIIICDLHSFTTRRSSDHRKSVV